MEGEEHVDTASAQRRDGDGSGEESFSLVYEELYRIARSQMAGQKPSHTLQPTALVNEAYLKLCASADRDVRDRAHFLRLASKVMRQILVEHARRKSAFKRDACGERVEFEALADEYERRAGGLVALDAAIERLEERDPELARLVELRFFGGRSTTEIAAILGVSVRQATRLWRAARLFLRREIKR